MIILAGLGNPGDKYARTRHNAGFMLIDAVHHHYGFSPWRVKFNALISDGRLQSGKALLIKPMAYMNRSGLPIKSALDFYKLTAADLTVIHDDIDLAPSKIKVRFGGGHGGHNGLRDIDRHIGRDYRRVRFGVGRSPFATPENKQVDSHVLSDFGTDEVKSWVLPLIDCMTREIDRLFSDDDNSFTTAVAQLCPPPRKEQD